MGLYDVMYVCFVFGRRIGVMFACFAHAHTYFYFYFRLYIKAIF